MRLVLSAAVALVIAGCVAPPTEPVDPSTATDALPFDPFGGLGDPLVVDHDHGDRAAHALATPSMSLLAHTTFEAMGATMLALGEADLLGEDHLLLAGFLGGGFIIADISDPSAPKAVSFTPDPGMMADIKASESGNFVFVGRQLGHFSGVEAFNVAAKERPVPAGAFPIAGTAPFRGGCHMLAVHKSHLYCAPNDDTVRILEIVETPGAVALIPKGIYAPKGPPIAPVLGGTDENGEMTHDMTVQDDPLTGEPVMYVSFWNYGLRVVDVSDPANPTELGAWLGEGAEEWQSYSGAIHTAMAGLVDGKRVLVTVPEYAPVPSVSFIDATDYAAMKAISVWAPKDAEELGTSASTFSTHNFQFLDGKVYMAMYHGGVWVLDVSDAAKLAAPAAIGYYLPAEPRPASAPGLSTPFGGSVTSVWDVVLKDGVIWATDMPSGLYAIQLDVDLGKELRSFA